jgi:hypothetical protein
MAFEVKACVLNVDLKTEPLEHFASTSSLELIQCFLDLIGCHCPVGFCILCSKSRSFYLPYPFCCHSFKTFLLLRETMI